MLKRASTVVLIISFFALLTAMGGKGGGFERVPRVEKDFAVVVTDSTGTKIEAHNFSWEGRLRFSGYMGMAEVNLPFDKVHEVTVGEMHDRKVRVTARLHNGENAVFDLDVDARCYGETNFGSFSLMMSEIKSIVFK